MEILTVLVALGGIAVFLLAVVVLVATVEFALIAIFAITTRRRRHAGVDDTSADSRPEPPLCPVYPIAWAPSARNRNHLRGTNDAA